MSPLGDLSPGQCATISRLPSRAIYRRKLLAMGVLPGTPIEVIRIAPMGDPIEIRIKGFSLSLRKDEASEVLVERITA